MNADVKRRLNVYEGRFFGQVKANSRSMAVLTSTGGSCWGYAAYGGEGMSKFVGLSGNRQT